MRPDADDHPAPDLHHLGGAGTTDLRRLRLFVELARDPHFGRTARRQHVSQPTLSAQIKRLEAELGVRLFERDGRGSQLSTAGRTLLPYAMELLDHADRFNAFAARQSGGPVAHGRRTTLRLQGEPR
jgi:DNA-binding transcriptional LysR family regulator